MKKLLIGLVVLASVVLTPFDNYGNSYNKLAYYEEIENTKNSILIEEDKLELDSIIALGTLQSVTEKINSSTEIKEVKVEPKETYYKVKSHALNKRKTPDTKNKPVGYLSKGEPVIGVEKLDNGWVKLSDGAYVNGKYLTKVEMTKDEFNQSSEDFKKAKVKLAEEKKAEVASKQKSIKSQTSSNISVARDGIVLTNHEKDLLARLVRAEAGGEPYEGMVAVASVVLNRVADSRFPNTIEGVIYAKNQFTPVSNGSINKPASDIHFKAVEDALTRDNANGAIFFYAPALVDSSYMESLSTVAVIGSHHFKVN